MKYQVILTIDASIDIEVEADSEEEAEQLAYEKAKRPCLCHQCSREVQLGDIMDAVEVTEIK